MMKNNKYYSPKIEIIRLLPQDVITNSAAGGGIIVTPEDEFDDENGASAP